jgi:anti-sigma factor RsiW
MPTGGSGEACPESVNAPAYCSGDLSDSERQAFEEHLGKCPACSVEMERTRRILDRLSTFKDVTVERDLAPEILARLSAPQPAMVRYWAYRRVWAAAAALIVVLGGTVGIWVAQRSHSRVRAETAATSAQNDALAWLCRAQGADGS